MGRMLPILRCVLLLLLCAAPVVAQSPADSDEVTAQKAQMNRDYNAGNWQAFTRAFTALHEAHPQAVPAGLWFRQGNALLELERYDAALQAFATAASGGFNAAFVAFSEAATHAAAGHPTQAFAALERAADAGFTNVMVLDSNPRLQPLHADARYRSVRDRMQDAHPCSRPECRQFDFWVGEWDVHGPNGGKAGTNHIEPILNRCALQENWSSAGGSGGQSINFFHPGRKKWVQLWVDASGSVIEIEGEYRDGAMRFTGTNTAADGSTELCRASWTLLEDGRVRQFWEQSRDEGETWYTWFDGYYSRQE